MSVFKHRLFTQSTKHIQIYIIMKKVQILLFASFLFITGINANFPPDTIPNNVFETGEKLKYVFYYGFIDGGTATLFVKEKNWKGKKVYHAQAFGKTTGITDRIYNVRDLFESFFDIETGLPYKAIRNIHEDTYRQYNEVVFDHENNIVHSEMSGKHDVPDNTLDLVSAFYYMRRVYFDKLEVGDILKVKTYFQDEIFDLIVRYKGKETIKTRIGKIKCLRFKPVVEEGRAFDDQDDVTIWISDDKNYIPIRLQMDLIVGSFKADLIEYSGLKHELKIIDD